MRVKIYYLLLPLITLPLIGAAKEISNEVIIVECNGKTKFTENSSVWDNHRFEIYQENIVLKIRSYWSNTGEKNWAISSSKETFPIVSNEYRTYPEQKESPSYFSDVWVTETEIGSNRGSNSSVGKDFENYSMESLRINRISGEWFLQREVKKYLPNGSWHSFYWETKGICKKGVKKF